MLVVITGGAMSGIGKGTISAGLGCVLSKAGHAVTHAKIDPYLNFDAGNMAPGEHGEVFVLEDGTQVDQDFGTYERFSGVKLSQEHTMTMGKLLRHVIEKERRRKYGGATVQLMKQPVNETREWLHALMAKHDIVLLELGGSVGDTEQPLFLEALQQIQREVRVFFLHVVPVIRMHKDLKTNPAQLSIQQLQSHGIRPNLIVARTDREPGDGARTRMEQKLTAKASCPVYCLADDADIYQIPMSVAPLYPMVAGHFRIKEQSLNRLRAFVEATTRRFDRDVRIAIIGKYAGDSDAYLSLRHALRHAALHLKCNVHVRVGDPDEYQEMLKECDGIVLPGGFGKRGFESLLPVVAAARTKHIPIFGICLGMQAMVVEFARSILCMENAGSEEFGSVNPVVFHCDGGMRLGAHHSRVKPHTKLHTLARSECITRRHRHRFAVTNNLTRSLDAKGMVVSATDWLVGNSVMAVELRHHSFYMGVQYHPEFSSTPEAPSPEFYGFLHACVSS